MTINIISDRASRKVLANGQKENLTPQSVMQLTQAEICKTGSDRVEDVADSLPGVQIGRFQAGIGSDLYLRGLGWAVFPERLARQAGLFRP